MDNGFYYSIGQNGKSKKVTIDLIEKLSRQEIFLENLGKIPSNPHFYELERFLCFYTLTPRHRKKSPVLSIDVRFQSPVNSTRQTY